MCPISIGVCVYNEEKNIKTLLNSLLAQKTKEQIKEIIVVSSACSDRTDEIIENDFSKSDPKIILLKQEKREGKASAINIFLEKAKGDIIVLESGDTIPAVDTIDKLTEAFSDPKIGMAGGRPMPINDPDTFMGSTVHLLWELHHKLAMRHPKLGELVAFRRDLIKRIPTDTAVDEAFIEALIEEKGYKLTYVPDAIVYNKGPENISDFLKQRRRIFAGHLHLKQTKGYAPSSMRKIEIMKLIIKDARLNPKKILWTWGAMILEFYGRALGSYDFYIKKDNPYIWKVAVTTKANLSETTINYTVAHEGNFLHSIRLWSILPYQIRYSESQLLPDTSVSISNRSEILPNTFLLSGTQQYPDKRNTKNLKNPGMR